MIVIKSEALKFEPRLQRSTQRLREIGLRKTLGASTQDTVLLLSGGFVRLALIGLAIACHWPGGEWIAGFSSTPTGRLWAGVHFWRRGF